MFGIFDNIQKNIDLFCGDNKSGKPIDALQKNVAKMKIAAVSLKRIGILAFVFSGVFLGKIFAASTKLGSLARLACAVVLYVLGHEALVVSINMEKFLTNPVTIIKGVWNNLGDLWSGEKKIDHVLADALTQGTVFKYVQARLQDQGKIKEVEQVKDNCEEVD